MSPVEPTTRTQDPSRPVAIVGAGSIGASFAIAFAQAGYRVRMQDPDPQRRRDVVDVIGARLASLEAYGLLGQSHEDITGRIAVFEALPAALEGAFHVQECAPENLELKRELYARMELLAEEDAVLASSTSAIPASLFAGELKRRDRCLVCHPTNPPYLVRVVEIVPAPFTSEGVTARTRRFLDASGFTSVVVRKEIEGFALNRLQGAMMREAYCLVRDGVLTVDEVDSLVRDGLGLRWSFMGPFETCDLNTRGGIASHALKMGPSYARMGAERGQNDPWTQELVAAVEKERRALVPLDDWEKMNEWRDRRLMALLRHRQDMIAVDTAFKN